MYEEAGDSGKGEKAFVFFRYPNRGLETIKNTTNSIAVEFRHSTRNASKMKSGRLLIENGGFQVPSFYSATCELYSVSLQKIHGTAGK